MTSPKLPARIPVESAGVAPESGSGYPAPFKQRVGHAEWRALGDHFGLTQFGVSQDTLAPGALSSLRHWHSLSDEFILVTAGELVLRTDDGEFTLLPGMCMGFKAGDRNAHHLHNRSALPATFIVVGARVPGDLPFYPDDDLAVMPTAKGRIAVHKNGRPYGDVPAGD